jgi:hypothetical protein
MEAAAKHRDEPAPDTLGILALRGDRRYSRACNTWGRLSRGFFIVSVDAPTPPEVPPEPPAPPAPPTPPATPATPSTEQPDTTLLVLKDKVQRFVTNAFGTVQIAPNGMLTLQTGSARVFVECRAWGDTGKSLVQVRAPVLHECPASPELYQHIATHADDFLFGHLSAQAEEGGNVTVWFTHTLLGDYLDPEEITVAVGGVAATADKIDDELKTRFGGKRFHDEVQ